jgi:hypothetical protein
MPTGTKTMKSRHLPRNQVIGLVLVARRHGGRAVDRAAR